jgi:hypothetical protein
MKRLIFDLVRLTGQRVFRVSARCSLLIASFSLTAMAIPGYDTLANYDTAWTFIYDGGKKTDTTSYTAIFRDAKVLMNCIVTITVNRPMPLLLLKTGIF